MRAAPLMNAIEPGHSCDDDAIRVEHAARNLQVALDLVVDDDPPARERPPSLLVEMMPVVLHSPRRPNILFVDGDEGRAGFLQCGAELALLHIGVVARDHYI